MVSDSQLEDFCERSLLCLNLPKTNEEVSCSVESSYMKPIGTSSKAANRYIPLLIYIQIDSPKYCRLNWELELHFIQTLCYRKKSYFYVSGGR